MQFILKYAYNYTIFARSENIVAVIVFVVVIVVVNLFQT